MKTTSYVDCAMRILTLKGITPATKARPVIRLMEPKLVRFIGLN